MPAFDNLRDTLRKHSGKIWSGIGAALLTPLVARIASRWTGRAVDRFWGSNPEGDGGDSTASVEGAESAAATGGERAAEEVQPAPRNYDEMTKRELYGLAQDLDIHGRSTMNKAELIEALRKYHAEES